MKALAARVLRYLVTLGADLAQVMARWLIAALLTMSVSTMVAATALQLNEIRERGAAWMTAVIGLAAVLYGLLVWGARTVKAIR